MTPFEKCLFLWLEVNEFALEIRDKYPDLEFLEVPSAKLFRSNITLAEIAKFSGFCKGNNSIIRAKENNPTYLFTLERRPIRDEWTNYEKHPEVIDLATRLGYDMSYAYIEGLIENYKLPKGILPYLRNKSGYWAHRESIGKLLRRFGLRK